MAKILLADDDKEMRALYVKILQDAGHTLDIVTDGKQALKKIYQGGYKLIILDVIMPQIDGLGVLHTLQKHPPKIKNGPILLFTNLAEDPAVEKALTKGASKVLVKTSLTPDEFVKEVNVLLGIK